jgi:tRNA (cytidine32/uridine32-2'-O)-methyltransferase
MSPDPDPDARESQPGPIESHLDQSNLNQPGIERLNRVRIVLVGTTLTRNIGAAARAMKVMGLRRLYLVQPKNLPDEDAFALAAGADDVLQQAIVCKDLASAIGDCTLVFGTSARRRDIVITEFSPAAAAVKALAMAAASEVALVFGAERTGLDNRELSLCQGRVQIPTDSDYGSLNLASAVQLIAYEIRLAAIAIGDNSAQQLRDVAPITQDIHVPATAVEFDRLMQHYSEFLKQINFYSTKNPEKLMTRLRRIFQRAAPDQREIQILRGILSEAQSALERRSVATPPP